MLFRVVNDELRELHRLFNKPEDDLSIVCECDDVGCTASIEMSAREYDQLRCDPHHFATRPEHERPADDTNESADGRYRITTHVDVTNLQRKNA
jgi:hypothetical protein